jgi:hypothetical protein
MTEMWKKEIREGTHGLSNDIKHFCDCMQATERRRVTFNFIFKYSLYYAMSFVKKK